MQSPTKSISGQCERDTSQRLYVRESLSHGVVLQLKDDVAHYLLHVLRKKSGENIRLFNGMDGEWRAEIAGLGKRTVDVVVGHLLRAQSDAKPLLLACAPIKKAHFDYMVEKATELGVTTIQPILTARTQVREVNAERLTSIAREAAEQSERLSLPEIREPIALGKLAGQRPADSKLVVCAEWGDAQSASAALSGLGQGRGGVIVTGPEGGFTADELAQLRKEQDAVFVRLGPRILRADTAAIAALTLWQGLVGDWQDA